MKAEKGLTMSSGDEWAERAHLGEVVGNAVKISGSGGRRQRLSRGISTRASPTGRKWMRPGRIVMAPIHPDQLIVRRINLPLLQRVARRTAVDRLRLILTNGWTFSEHCYEKGHPHRPASQNENQSSPTPQTQAIWIDSPIRTHQSEGRTGQWKSVTECDQCLRAVRKIDVFTQ
jgi:hypothetical protein